MSLNVLKVQQDPVANITDLHAFVVDKNGVFISDPAKLAEGDQLIVSLCVQRALLPQKIENLDFKGYRFIVRLDLDPPVRFFDEAKTREGDDYAAALRKLDQQVMDTTDPKLRSQLVTARGRLISDHESDRGMQALYGGIFTLPDAIAEGATLQFELGLDKNGEDSVPRLTWHHVEGIPGPTHIIGQRKSAQGWNEPDKVQFQPGAVNIEAGVFDDPFIFPRFFRKNVVGIVTSIPLALLPAKARTGGILLWATTHQGARQIDHVGRSLRTQLPRFGYLNDKPPAAHAREITRVHDHPSVMEDVLATFLAPLEAHRYYDTVPDVMVYDLSRPANFPNGRYLADDVGGALGAAGETLLQELSFTESRQFPRTTVNDKAFLPYFPYLAGRWTDAEIAQHAAVGSTLIPDSAGKAIDARAPEAPAIAMPNLRDSTWRTLWLLEVAALVLFTILLLVTLRSCGARFLVVLIAILTVCSLQFVYRDNLKDATKQAMQQPSEKLMRLLLGAAVIVVFKLAWWYALGRLSCRKWPVTPEPLPEGPQGISTDDLNGPNTYKEIDDALFHPDRKVTGRYYDIWGEAGDAPLPVHRQTFWSITRGLFRYWADFALLRAAKRTLRSRADLRWGRDRKGFHRLLHANGICLKGKWEIAADTEYTGYFAKGSVGRVIARYSLGGNEPRNGHSRSLGMAGKLFMGEQSTGDDPEPRASFITQEDIGGALTHSITEVKLLNSPPVALNSPRGNPLAFPFIIYALFRADARPSERQLYEISELGMPEGAKIKTPKYMWLKAVDASAYTGGDFADFRDEILGRMYKRGEAGLQRPLKFEIRVTDKGRRNWLQKIVDRDDAKDWQTIGTLTFTEAVASWNGDFVVHFHHPVWRNELDVRTSIRRGDLRREFEKQEEEKARQALRP